MIPRYSRPAMAAIWEPANKFRIWFEIEAHAADALAQAGAIPKSAARMLWKRGHAPYTPERIARIDRIEAEVKHDVIAFLTELAERVGPEARFVHQGLTSSDVLDTCLAVQMVEAADLLIADVDRLLAALAKRARQYKNTPCIGRSHGIHAEPTTLVTVVREPDGTTCVCQLTLARRDTPGTAESPYITAILDPTKEGISIGDYLASIPNTEEVGIDVT